MASKFGVIACLACGEYVRSTMIDSIEQFEMHMCCFGSADETRQKLLNLRDVVDEEIAKITHTSQLLPVPVAPPKLPAATPFVPKPPKLPPKTLPPPTLSSPAKTQGL